MSVSQRIYHQFIRRGTSPRTTPGDGRFWLRSSTRWGLIDWWTNLPQDILINYYEINEFSQIKHRGWYDQPKNTTYIEFNDISGSEHVRTFWRCFIFLHRRDYHGELNPWSLRRRGCFHKYFCPHPSLHQVGTHTDAPVHVSARSDSWRVDEIPLERLSGPAVVIDITWVSSNSEISHCSKKIGYINK